MEPILLPEFDPESELFRANPYPVYKLYQQYSPIYYREKYNDWIITSYKHIKEIINNNAHRSKQKKNTKLVNLEWENVLKINSIKDKLSTIESKLADLTSDFLNNLSPPYHTHLRKNVSPQFLPKNMEYLRPRIQELANELIDENISKGEIDIVNGYAFPLTVKIICELLGISADNKDNFRKWTYFFVQLVDLYFHNDKLKGKSALFSMANYFSSIITTKSENLGDDILSDLIRAKMQNKITNDNILSLAMNLLAGGFVNTQNAISLSIYYLLKFPDQLKKLKENPELIKTAVEELLRYTTPLQSISYYCTNSFEIENYKIENGQRINLIIGAANRDPEKFSSHDELDITRSPNPHLSFSSGTHFCIGAPLARLEMEIAISTILNRLPNLRLNDCSPEISDIYFMRGFKDLNLSF